MPVDTKETGALYVILGIVFFNMCIWLVGVIGLFGGPTGAGGSPEQLLGSSDFGVNIITLSGISGLFTAGIGTTLAAFFNQDAIKFAGISFFTGSMIPLWLDNRQIIGQMIYNVIQDEVVAVAISSIFMAVLGLILIVFVIQMLAGGFRGYK